MNYIKKAFALYISVCLLTMSLVTVVSASGTFSDVPEGSPYYEAVEFVVDEGLFNGMGNNEFCPDYPFSRPMLMTVLWRLSGSPDVVIKKGRFTDVDDNAWYAKGISWATDRGITTGIGDGQFGIDMPLSREQLAMFLYRYAEYMELNVEQGKGIGLGSFDDGHDVANYARDAIKWAYWNNIIIVDDNKLNPKGEVSRGEAALGLYNFLVAYVGEIAVEEVSATPVPTVVPATAAPVVTPKPTPVRNDTFGPNPADMSKFPSDYYEALSILSVKYPQWKFVPVFLDQDWDDAVVNETGRKSLLEKSVTSPLLLNKSEGYYNPDTSSFVNYDAGGWVSAAANAVAYYMDPRNLLNEQYIFQFELLSYNDSIHTIDGVEAILDGTFMSNAQITYITTEGTETTEDMTYAEAIMAAAEISSASPYYLASKIRQEVIISGGRPSGSVSGQYGGYTGVYNFYNIGANDGANPVANGLAWASSDTGTYMRPWNKPSDSIIGGAIMIAESYISQGQDTSYLQRFDVQGQNRFVHQYMTSLTGPTAAAYFTYQSYKEMDSLDTQKVFAIPIYQNMPPMVGSLNLNVSGGRTATVNGDYVNIRSGPGTSYDAVGHVIRGDVLSVMGSSRLSSPSGWTYVVSDLTYPYWYHISINGVTGYICADYVTVNNNITLQTGGTYNLSWTALDSDGNVIDYTPYFDSSNFNVATVDKNGLVTAKGSGTATVRVYGGGCTDSVTVTVE